MSSGNANGLKAESRPRQAGKLSLILGVTSLWGFYLGGGLWAATATDASVAGFCASIHPPC